MKQTIIQLLTSKLNDFLQSATRASSRLRKCFANEWTNAEYLNRNGAVIGSWGKIFPRLDYVVLGAFRTAPVRGVQSRSSSDPRNPKAGKDVFHEMPEEKARYTQKWKSYVKAETNRSTFFGQIKPNLGLGLEIGPLHTPICKKPEYQIRYIDAFSTTELKEQHSSSPDVPVQDIVEVDYVWTGQPYSQLITEKFDFVVTSHNVEHVPCLIGFMTNLASCLRRGGMVYLAIPDKRYCFDYYKPESSIDEVLEAQSVNRTRPTPRQLIRHELLQTHNDSRRHWIGDHGVPKCIEDQGAAERALNAMSTYRSDDCYRDTHCWIFTPGSFAEIMEFLFEYKLINLQLTALHPTEPNSHEFYAVLILR